MSTVDVTTSGDTPSVLPVTLADVLTAARLAAQQAMTSAQQSLGSFQEVQAEGQAALAAAAIAQAAARDAEAAAQSSAQARGNVPPGGALGQVLTKRSNSDGDYDWEAATGGSGGGDNKLRDLSDVDSTAAAGDGQVLTYVASTQKYTLKALPATSSGTSQSSATPSGQGAAASTGVIVASCSVVCVDNSGNVYPSPAPSNQLNVASVTRLEAGQYKVVFTNPIPAHCMPIASAIYADGNNDASVPMQVERRTGAYDNADTSLVKEVVLSASYNGGSPPFDLGRFWLQMVDLTATITAASNSASSGSGSTAAAKHLGYRVKALTIGGNTFGVGQVIFKDASGNVIPSTGGKSLASSTFNGSFYSSDQPFSGNAPTNGGDSNQPGSGWYAASGQKVGEYIGYQFASAQAVASITILPPGDSTGPTDSATSFEIETTDDGTAWVATGAHDASGWATGVGQTFRVGGSAGGGSTATSSRFPPFSPPKMADYSVALNDGTALSMADDPDVGLYYYIAGASPSGDRIRAQTRAITATGDWTFVARLKVNIPTHNYMNVGLALYRAGQPYVTHFGINASSGTGKSLAVNRFNQSGTGYQDNQGPANGAGIDLELFLQMTYTAANDTLTFAWSKNGKRFIVFVSTTGANQCGGAPDHIGFCLAPNNTDNINWGEMGAAVDYLSTNAY